MSGWKSGRLDVYVSLFTGGCTAKEVNRLQYSNCIEKVEMSFFFYMCSTLNTSETKTDTLCL